jgi:hypothetical protein
LCFLKSTDILKIYLKPRSCQKKKEGKGKSNKKAPAKTLKEKRAAKAEKEKREKGRKQFVTVLLEDPQLIIGLFIGESL